MLIGVIVIFVQKVTLSNILITCNKADDREVNTLIS